MTTVTKDKYLAKVLNTLQTNPTAAELDELVAAFVNVGYIAAEAEGLAEEAENRRKHEEANAYLKAKKGGGPGTKVTEREAEAVAAVETWDYKRDEVEARVKARKLKNLLDAVEQNINAIKFLGRAGG